MQHLVLPGRGGLLEEVLTDESDWSTVTLLIAAAVPQLH